MVSPPDWLVPSTLPASTDTEHPCTATESPVPGGMGCRAQGKAGGPSEEDAAGPSSSCRIRSVGQVERELVVPAGHEEQRQALLEFIAHGLPGRVVP
jgi:hypothetical protein